MTLNQAILQRRSIRRFKDEVYPDDDVRKALELALLAPNSSNTQTWNFSWVKSEQAKSALTKACLSQSAARTASHLVVVSADPKLWRRSRPRLLKWVREVNAHASVLNYYEKLVPFMYRYGFLNSFGWLKRLMFWLIGWFRPIMRGPCLRYEQEMVALKSAALAAENFVLAIESLGGATCMMEGFDEVRVKRLCCLSRSSRIAMVIAVGYAGENGTWGERWRLPFDEVVTEF